jgi:hypothetical protein
VKTAAIIATKTNIPALLPDAKDRLNVCMLGFSFFGCYRAFALNDDLLCRCVGLDQMRVGASGTGPLKQIAKGE